MLSITNNQQTTPNNVGFTLIELLIVIAIIAILSSFGMFAFTSAQSKSRDSQRKNDLNQLKKALILARNDCNGGYYPKGTTGTSNLNTEKDSYTLELIPNLTSSTDFSKYLNNASLNDPLFGSKPATYHYGFRADPTSAIVNVCPDPTTRKLTNAGTSVFVLRALLELNSNDPDSGKTYTACATPIATIGTANFDSAPASGDGFYYVCGN